MGDENLNTDYKSECNFQGSTITVLMNDIRALNTKVEQLPVLVSQLQTLIDQQKKFQEGLENMNGMRARMMVMDLKITNIDSNESINKKEITEFIENDFKPVEKTVAQIRAYGVIAMFIWPLVIVAIDKFWK